jgi:hypothetical protein
VFVLSLNPEGGVVQYNTQDWKRLKIQRVASREPVVVKIAVRSCDFF